MGIHVIKMPDIGEGIAEVELAAWNVQPGDHVAEDQSLADVMTDKATVEIPSPVAGKVLSLGCQPGVLLAVGAELIRIEVEGEGNERNRPAAPAPGQAAPAPADRDDPGTKPLASPAVRQYAREHDVQPAPSTGQRPGRTHCPRGRGGPRPARVGFAVVIQPRRALCRA